MELQNKDDLCTSAAFTLGTAGLETYCNLDTLLSLRKTNGPRCAANYYGLGINYYPIN